MGGYVNFGLLGLPVGATQSEVEKTLQEVDYRLKDAGDMALYTQAMNGIAGKFVDFYDFLGISICPMNSEIKDAIHERRGMLEDPKYEGLHDIIGKLTQKAEEVLLNPVKSNFYIIKHSNQHINQ